MAVLTKAYPWIKLPLVVSAPMLGAATPLLAARVSQAGGIGFIAGGTNANQLDSMLNETTKLLEGSTGNNTLPIGVGFQLFNSPLAPLAEVIAKHKPAAVWLFAPKVEDELEAWASKIRAVTSRRTKIWIQVGSVSEAVRALKLAGPDVLVMQGHDAGGHANRKSASIISLVPEVIDTLQHSDLPILAAGGMVDSRGVAAALSLGASGVVMGTRFLVAEESGIAAGWKNQIIRTQDGGLSTIKSTVSDRLKETKGWPEKYDGRAVKNQGHIDDEAGLSDEENVRRYKEEIKRGSDADWGVDGRMVAYAGTGVGLVKREEKAGAIVRDVRDGTLEIMDRAMVSAGRSKL